MSNRTTDLVTLDFRGAAIRRVDVDGKPDPRGDYLHATDMWKAAGSPANKTPRDYERLDSAAALVKALESEERAPDPILRIAGNPRVGDGGGKAYCREVALDYAGHLDIDFRLFVLRSFLAVVEPRPDDAIKIAAPGVEAMIERAMVASEERLAHRFAEMLRAQPAPAILAHPPEAIDGAIEATGDRLAEKFLISADPNRPMGDQLAKVIRDEMKRLAKIEASRLYPSDEWAQKQKARSILSRAQVDVREAIRCGHARYAAIPMAYAQPFVAWIGKWRTRLHVECSTGEQGGLF